MPSQNTLNMVLCLHGRCVARADEDAKGPAVGAWSLWMSVSAAGFGCLAQESEAETETPDQAIEALKAQD